MFLPFALEALFYSVLVDTAHDGRRNICLLLPKVNILSEPWLVSSVG